MYDSQPKWWVLYGIVPLMGGMLFLVSQSGLAPWEKMAANVVIVAAGFGAMALWMNTNEGEIERAEYAEHRRAVAKLHRIAYAWRSRTPARRARTSRHAVRRTSGFGSARFKPVPTYQTQQLGADRVRVVAYELTMRNKVY